MSEVEIRIKISLLDIEAKVRQGEKNFTELVIIYDRIIQLNSISDDNNIHAIVLYTMKKAYCLARLNKKQEAKLVMEAIDGYSFFLDRDEYNRMKMLVTFFIWTDANKLLPMHLNTIKSWLTDPEASKQVVGIIFDYKDLVGNIEPFNHSRLEIKQTSFSNKLLKATFSAMRRNNDVLIYYNKERNDIQQEVEDYLISHLAADQVAENRKLANRIMNLDARDLIIEGVHYLIPRLTFVKYFNVFLQKSHFSNFFSEQLKTALMNEYHFVEDINNLAFSDGVANSFIRELNQWIIKNELDIEFVREKVIETEQEIALELLQAINS